MSKVYQILKDKALDLRVDIIDKILTLIREKGSTTMLGTSVLPTYLPNYNHGILVPPSFTDSGYRKDCVFNLICDINAVEGRVETEGGFICMDWLDTDTLLDLLEYIECIDKATIRKMKDYANTPYQE